MIALAAFALAGCLAVAPGSDSIRAGDLAPAFAGMESLAPGTIIAPAPLPGFTRVFHAAELRRLAAAYALPGPPAADICIRRPVAPLDPQQMLEAMRREWPEARIEIVEFARQAAPEGAIHFPRSGLHSGYAASSAGALWTGWIGYGERGRFSIWARVKISVPVERIVAVRDLQPGRAVAAEDVQLTRRDEIPQPSRSWAATLDQVIGKIPRLPIRAGEALRPDQFEEPKTVLQGDTVKVVVRNGAAQLELAAVAEGSGAVGEVVLVRNPDSHRRFRARVEGRGRVTVDAGGILP